MTSGAANAGVPTCVRISREEVAEGGRGLPGADTPVDAGTSETGEQLTGMGSLSDCVPWKKPPLGEDGVAAVAAAAVVGHPAPDDDGGVPAEGDQAPPDDEGTPIWRASPKSDSLTCSGQSLPCARMLSGLMSLWREAGSAGGKEGAEGVGRGDTM